VNRKEINKKDKEKKETPREFVFSLKRSSVGVFAVPFVICRILSGTKYDRR